MAKIVIAGDAVVVTSSVKLADYKKIKKYRPKALTLLGGEDGKEPIFCVGVTNGAGSIRSAGVEFGKGTRDGAGLACLTTTLDGVETEDIKGYVADKFGPAVLLLGKIEEKIPGILEEIEAEEAAILSNITVTQ